MTPDKATPEVEAYEPPKMWDIGELTELTQGDGKVHKFADFNSLQPEQQGYFS